MTKTLEQQLRDEFVTVAAGLSPVRFGGGEVMARGRSLQRRRRSVVAAGVAALAVVATGLSLYSPARRENRVLMTTSVTAAAPTISTAPAVVPRPVPTPLRGALAIDGRVQKGGALDRHNPAADSGPWSVVVRRSDGSLGRHGAVVSFPVDEAVPVGARVVDIAGATGHATEGMLVWPLSGANARVRGDLSEAELTKIAAGTSVVAGRPEVSAPEGFSVIWSGPFHAASTREVRDGSSSVGEPVLGIAPGDALVFTAATMAGEFEDALYSAPLRSAQIVTVKGKPGMFSTIHGGNAILMWEHEPGVVVYVGYSGESFGSEQEAALRRLAERAVMVDESVWRGAGPQVV